jgi:hypothetical protein
VRENRPCRQNGSSYADNHSCLTREPGTLIAYLCPRYGIHSDARKEDQPMNWSYVGWVENKLIISALAVILFDKDYNCFVIGLFRFFSF